MYAQVNMFNSVQSVSVVKYPAKKFKTEILHRPGESAGTPSAIGKEIGAAVVMKAAISTSRRLRRVPILLKRPQMPL